MTSNFPSSTEGNGSHDRPLEVIERLWQTSRDSSRELVFTLGYFAALVIGMMASLPYIIRDLGQFLICHYGKVQDILQSGFTLATPQSPHSKANSQKPLT